MTEITSAQIAAVLFAKTQADASGRPQREVNKIVRETIAKMNVTDEMVAAFKRSAFDRQMHEDGCPDGEGIRAGIAAIAPMIRALALEDAAKVADQHMLKADEAFNRRVHRARRGEKNLELAAAADAGMSHEARKIAAAIRAMKNLP